MTSHTRRIVVYADGLERLQYCVGCSFSMDTADLRATEEYNGYDFDVSWMNHLADIILTREPVEDVKLTQAGEGG
jgi:hypothetical protein